MKLILIKYNGPPHNYTVREHCYTWNSSIENINDAYYWFSAKQWLYRKTYERRQYTAETRLSIESSADLWRVESAVFVVTDGYPKRRWDVRVAVVQ